MLREKTAEALVGAPARFWLLDSDSMSDEEDSYGAAINESFEANHQAYNGSDEDLDSDYMLPFGTDSMANLVVPSDGSFLLW